MKTFYSISQYPGKTGFKFYNYFFNKYQMDARYVPVGCDPNNFTTTFNDLKSVASGISVSMPFKKEVLGYLDQASLEVENYNTCNTIDLQSKKVIGYNTDLHGVIASVSKIKYDDRIIILGNGSMGKMFYKYMKGIGYNYIKLISRSLNNYDQRHNPCDVFINCTSFGTVNTESPLTTLHANTRLVIDCSIKKCSLFEQVRKQSIQYFSGLDFYKHQFKKQFLIYTGIDITMHDINLVPVDD